MHNRGGTNDFVNDVPLECFKDAYNSMLDAALSKGFRRIIVFTPYCFKTGDKGLDWPDESGNRVNWPNKAGNTLDEYVDIIISICAEEDIEVLDLYRDSNLDMCLNNSYYYDTVHLNEQGHRYIADLLIDTIETTNGNVK